MEEFSRYIRAQEQNLFHLLEKLVLQPSYSRNKQDVDKVGRLITDELADLDLSREVYRQDETGNHLLFRTAACEKHSASILLVGHMDTVFPPESGFNWYKQENGKTYGPGVIDMKGGLVSAIFALKALGVCNLLDEIPITLICNSDEEIGSPTSRQLMTDEAEKGLCGLVFECGGLNGEIVTGRKGKGGFTLEVTGQAGHAAFAVGSKASAILEMAHKVIAVEKLNDPTKQLVVNVGTIEGGIGPNTIPEKASIEIDVRYIKKSDGEECEASLKRIAHNCTTVRTSGALLNTGGRKPMEQSERNRLIFDTVAEIAEELTITVKDELRSGVSDANTLAAAGLPVIDGMGPIGDCDHSDREYMISESLPQKTLLAAHSIAELWKRHQDKRLNFA